ncbi:MAG: imidazoleglycerol-phosphate dehydratase HisB, partial [Parvularculaceae bacterium]
ALSSVCGAVVGSAALIKRLIDSIEPDFLQPQILAEAQALLAPQRLALLEGRVKSQTDERARLAEALKSAGLGLGILLSDGPQIVVSGADADLVLARARALDAPITRGPDGFVCVAVFEAAANDRTLAAFGSPANRRVPRIAEVVRETKETKIAVRVDLDRSRDIVIDTGIGYYDHMLEQIAAHGGFSLRLACIGDRHVDLHHTIEDCALALGAALSQALGERRGIARYGFLLPMDEAEAKASIDLGGRPYAVFEGSFAAPMIGDYPTEMTSHVFRSLAQTLGAAIHIEVKGENDHHKTEAAFKAFARALRAAIAVDGDAIPSTKGIIS